jgi:hypothetical protein
MCPEYVNGKITSGQYTRTKSGLITLLIVRCMHKLLADNDLSASSIHVKLARSCKYIFIKCTPKSPYKQKLSFDPYRK